ncbi:hypothetical protein AVI51_13245 [Piscirickettsia salmonis]|nr:hypothetical protein [Piscirickettsia salmonis]ERL60752.1 hypothetical protein K661_02926 [Piscirickettsia salmonis LF-89 = ATCC VR-1361]APS44407.1 hypothetical protein AVI48_08530 [Piscirickettsia salmonis]APS47768.1 hypothetical protein AVI49_09140 [Piscirickettsia salmonis]APS51718.1 hypothetical protein AVI50_13365 [Piscirickettsia salmonis]APS54936.1 hypothetical protein AVI51_13245 [Piscirickettsia salmonis]
MSPQQEKLFWKKFERELGFDSGEAALSHLSAGRPIYYGDDRYSDAVIKEYPDGTKQLVRFDDNDNEIIIEEL